jgi:hypothetical protein
MCALTEGGWKRAWVDGRIAGWTDDGWVVTCLITCLQFWGGGSVTDDALGNASCFGVIPVVS